MAALVQGGRGGGKVAAGQVDRGQLERVAGHGAGIVCSAGVVQRLAVELRGLVNPPLIEQAGGEPAPVYHILLDVEGGRKGQQCPPVGLGRREVTAGVGQEGAGVAELEAGVIVQSGIVETLFRVLEG